MVLPGLDLSNVLVSIVGAAQSGATGTVTPTGAGSNAQYTPRVYAHGYNLPEKVLSYSASIQQTLPDQSVLNHRLRREPGTQHEFADVVDRESRLILLKNFLVLSANRPDFRVDEIRARVSMEQKIGARDLSVLRTPLEHYQVPLSTFRGAGLLLHARLNEGSELALILDTGATGIVLNASAECRLDLKFLTRARILGFDTKAPPDATVALARYFDAGGLGMANLVVQMSETEITPDADGAIGLDVFEKLLIK